MGGWFCFRLVLVVCVFGGLAVWLLVFDWFLWVWLAISVVRLVLCSVGLGLFLGRGGSFAVCWLDLYNFCGIACWWFDVGRVWCWVLLVGLGCCV